MISIKPITHTLSLLPIGVASVVRHTPLSVKPLKPDSVSFNEANIMTPAKATQIFRDVLEQGRLGEGHVDKIALRKLLTYVQDVSITSIQKAEPKLGMRWSSDIHKYILPESTLVDDSIWVTRTFKDTRLEEPNIQKINYRIDFPIQKDTQVGLTSNIAIERAIPNENELQRPFYKNYIGKNHIFPSVSITGNKVFYEDADEILSCFEAGRAIIKFNLTRSRIEPEMQVRMVDF